MNQHLLIDLETTGLEATGHNAAAILEIAAIPLDAQLKVRESVPTFQVLVRPFEGAHIDSQALHINHHHWACAPSSVKYQQAKPIDEALALLNTYVAEHFGHPPTDYKDRVILCGWNVGFDATFLKVAFAYADTSFYFHYHLLDFMGICRYLDTLTQNVRTTGYKLERMAKYYFGFPLVKMTAHTALGDCRLAHRVLEKVQEETLAALLRGA